MKQVLPALLFLLFAAVAAQAQITVAPANPTASDVVQLLLVPQCAPPIVTRTGNAFRIDGGQCYFEPITPPITLGQLPAGTYTYAVYLGEQNLVASGSFVVAPAIPTLSPWALLALGLLLSVAGVVALGRYNFL